MPQGEKSSSTDKQKRQASHIVASYDNKGVTGKTAETRAWAAVNKLSGGGKMGVSGIGAAIRSSVRQMGSSMT